MSTRRDFLKTSAYISAASLPGASFASEPINNKPPNVLMICADQFRADFVGAFGENPGVRTPNLDAMCARGTAFTQTMCNQPVCAPSRSSFLTSRYATEAGIWRNGPELNHELPTIADVFGKAGYATYMVGKWHVSQNELPGGNRQWGWIPPGPSRGGFEFWEGANEVERTSHPYDGSYWNNEGEELKFENQYRVDVFTDRALKIIEGKHHRPWFLFLSQLEPHQQNDLDAFVPPHGYEEKYRDPFVPADLRLRSGTWQHQLPGYYGCVQAIDESVGRLLAALEKTGQAENTVVLFFSDHGNHFRTHKGEYKRSPYDSALRVPFILQGPRLNTGQQVRTLTTLLDLAPTLIDAAGLKPPLSMKGRTVLPLLHDARARSTWEQVAYVQISESMCGRALRTPEWCYLVLDPGRKGGEGPFGQDYMEWALFSISGDPVQMDNVISRPENREAVVRLRATMLAKMKEAGEPRATIKPNDLFY